MDFNPIIIGVAGASGSGKTTLTQRMEEIAMNIAATIEQPLETRIIRMDDYYRDRSHLTPPEREGINYDVPGAVELDLLADNLAELRQGQAVEKPKYDFTAHNRKTEWEVVQPSPFIIIDGIFALHEELRELYDLKVFVNTPEVICWERRKIRDVEERGRTIEEVDMRLQRDVIPGYQKFVRPTRQYADMEFVWNGDTEHIELAMQEVMLDLLKKRAPQITSLSALRPQGTQRNYPH